MDNLFLLDVKTIFSTISSIFFFFSLVLHRFLVFSETSFDVCKLLRKSRFWLFSKRNSPQDSRCIHSKRNMFFVSKSSVSMRRNPVSRVYGFYAHETESPGSRCENLHDVRTRSFRVFRVTVTMVVWSYAERIDRLIFVVLSSASRSRIYIGADVGVSGQNSYGRDQRWELPR